MIVLKVFFLFAALTMVIVNGFEVAIAFAPKEMDLRDRLCPLHIFFLSIPLRFC